MFRLRGLTLPKNSFQIARKKETVIIISSSIAFFFFSDIFNRPRETRDTHKLLGAYSPSPDTNHKYFFQYSARFVDLNSM